MTAFDLLRGDNAVHVGHADIHEDDVGLLLFEHGERLEPVCRNADHLDLGAGGEHAPDAVGKDGLIVRKKYAYFFRWFHTRYLVLSFRTPSAGSVI